MEERRRRFAEDREQLEKEQGVRELCLVSELCAVELCLVSELCDCGAVSCQ